MKRLFLYLFFLAAVYAAPGCKKDSTKKDNSPDAVELLTEKPWKLLSYGYDYNNNGLIDSSEENISSCQKDNTCVFNPNGSGTVMENTMICDGSKASVQFSWTLTNNKTMLDFIYGSMFIAKISQDDLIITDTNSDPAAKLIVSYAH
jgi:hypothetical protein